MEENSYDAKTGDDNLMKIFMVVLDSISRELRSDQRERIAQNVIFSAQRLSENAAELSDHRVVTMLSAFAELIRGDQESGAAIISAMWPPRRNPSSKKSNP